MQYVPLRRRVHRQEAEEQLDGKDGHRDGLDDLIDFVVVMY